MIKAFKRFLWTIGLLIVGVILGLGYLGFVPGLSSLFGSATPRDLQATHNAADVVSAQAKLKQQLLTKETTPSLSTIRNGGTSEINTTLTGREFSAHAEAVNPVKDLQVVFHTDGTFEAAGRIDKSRIFTYVRLLGYAKVTDAGVLGAVNQYLPGSPTFYIKGTGAVTKGIASMTLTEARLGRLPASTTALAKALVEYYKLSQDKIPGFDITTMNVGASGLTVVGTVPAVIPAL